MPDTKLREWAKENLHKLAFADTYAKEADIVELAGESMIRQCAEILDVCECGDYRHQHENGTGKCNLCGNSRAPYDGCQKFRKSKVATGADAILRYYGIGEGK